MPYKQWIKKSVFSAFSPLPVGFLVDDKRSTIGYHEEKWNILEVY